MALSRHASITRPLSISELTSRATDFDFPTNRPLQSWLRSAKMLLTEASICEQDADLQMSYLYLYRHAELVLSKFPQHPEINDVKLRHDVARARKDVQKNLVKMEQLRPRIQEAYSRWHKAMERRDREAGMKEEERRKHSNEDANPRDSTPEDQLFNEIGQAISAVENNQLAVDVARQELRRRDFSRQAELMGRASSPVKHHAPPSPRQLAHGLHSGIDRVHDGVRDVGRHLHHKDSRYSTTFPNQQSSSTKYNYPSVPAKEGAMSWDQLPPPARPTKEPYTQIPSLPPKDPQETYQPDLPPKLPKQGGSTSPATTDSPPPRPSMPSHKYTITSTSTTESGSPLRTILLPASLRNHFLSFANANTLSNLETCGILCGTVIASALTITHLILPSQTSTSDTCDTTPEGDNALFDYCDAHSLLVCGWIHTHPTQSCFLSSRDCHTTSGYQVMLPEAIAIVCAPRSQPEWGCFRLTDPPGLPLVLECTKPGTFHPHEVPGGGGLYTDAVGKGGHVVEAKGLGFETVDLRV